MYFVVVDMEVYKTIWYNYNVKYTVVMLLWLAELYSFDLYHNWRPPRKNVLTPKRIEAVE